MRPVNLIPTEQRRGPGARAKGGPLTYIVLGALVALLAGVTLLVITNNQISDREAEVSRLESENAAAEARAAELAAYVELQTVRDQRVATVTSLADSRFDWERVMNELALILPSDVWLTNLTGTVKPEVAVNGATSVALRASVPGPALEMIGCAKGQEAVAGFVSDLKDIDGVTRVAMQSSELASGSESGGGGGDSAGGGGSTECQTRDFIAKFQLVAAFDAAPIPATGTEGE
ncbi:MAG: PilN domain-containing protein [Solirubrobacterales bacterium]